MTRLDDTRMTRRQWASFGGDVLLQFTVGNYLSFKAKATLSMLALPGATGEQDPRVLALDGLPPVLRSAAIYGANASGKSNLVEALWFAREQVRRGARPDERIDVTPFKLDASSVLEPSSFEFEIALGSKRYSYGFLVSEDRVEEEWLYSGQQGEACLFTREHDVESPDRSKIVIGPTLAGSPERQQFISFVADGTRSNQLFLTEAAERNVWELEELVEWFRSGLRINDPAALEGHNQSKFLASSIEQDEGLRDFLGTFLARAGTGIGALRTEQDPRFDAFLRMSPEGPGQPLSETKLRALALRAGYLPDVRLAHETGGRASVEFQLDEESDGTRRLLDLGPEIYRLRQEGRDTTVVADELDRSLHTLMSRFVVRAFHEASANNHSQLIFTTHDTNLLDLTLLRRESIWFVEKDAGGASQLYSLAEFDAEQVDALQSAVERGYLQGRFGAVPFLGDPQRLGWTAAKTAR